MSEKIPFDIEKWQTGNYDAVYRDGSEPIEVLVNNYAIRWRVISIDVTGELLTHTINGFYSLNGVTETCLDIFLTPKKKKGWVVVCKRIDIDVIFTDHSYSDEQHSEDKEHFIKEGCTILYEAEFEY